MLRPWPLILFAIACIVLGYLFFSFGSEVAERETGTFDGVVRELKTLGKVQTAETTSEDVTAAVSSRTGCRSSRIQIDRPCVPTTRLSPFTTRS